MRSFEDVDDDNATRYHTGCDSFICLLCEETVDLDGSISSRGRNLICNSCVHKLAQLLGKSHSDILTMIQRRDWK